MEYREYMGVQGVHESTWEYMGVHGSTWEYMGVHGSTWEYSERNNLFQIIIF
jgi:hypothetical protein